MLDPSADSIIAKARKATKGKKAVSIVIFLSFCVMLNLDYGNTPLEINHHMSTGTLNITHFENPKEPLPYLGPSMPEDMELATGISKHMKNLQSDLFPDQHEVCVTPPMLHDPRKQIQQEYFKRVKNLLNARHDHPVYPINTIASGGRVAFYRDRPGTTDSEGRKITGLLMDRFSVWGEDSEGNNVDIVKLKNGPEFFIPPFAERLDVYKRIVIEGNFASFFGRFAGNYGHILHDHLPGIAYLRQVMKSKYGDNFKMILQDTPVARSIVETVDPEFYANQVVWIKLGQLLQISNGELVTFDNHGIPIWGMVDYLRLWLAETDATRLGITPPASPQPYIIYYTRGGEDTHHGRVMNDQNQRDIIDLIRQKMAAYNRPEELIIYDGTDEVTGKTMSVQKQAQLFRSASTAIGPHGSGLANVVWMDVVPTSCETRPHILEFLTCSDNAYKVHVQWSDDSYGKTYSHFYWGMELDYHHAVYTKNSTNAVMYVELENIANALDDMWGPRSTN